MATRRLPGTRLGLACAALALLLGCEDDSRQLPAPQAQRPLAEQGPYLGCDRAAGRWVCVGAAGRILRSADAGRSWQLAGSPPARLLTAIHFIDATHGWAVGHDGVILHSSDGGAHWSMQRSDPEADVPLFAVRFRDRRHGVAVGAFGLVVRTDDGGAHWHSGEAGEEGLHLYGLVEQGDAWLVAGEQGLLMRSTDDGHSWQELRAPDGHSLFGLVALADARLLAFGLGGRLALSGDGGASWRSATLPRPLTLHAAAVRDGRAWLVAADGSLWLLGEDDRPLPAPLRVPPATASLSSLDDGQWLSAGLAGIRVVGPEAGP